MALANTSGRDSFLVTLRSLAGMALAKAAVLLARRLATRVPARVRLTSLIAGLLSVVASWPTALMRAAVDCPTFLDLPTTRLVTFVNFACLPVDCCRVVALGYTARMTLAIILLLSRETAIHSADMTAAVLALIYQKVLITPLEIP